MSWLHRVLGNDGVTQLAVEANTAAARATLRPINVGTAGSYAFSALSGTMAVGLGAASTVFSARWTSSTLALIPRLLRVYAKNITTAFAAGAVLFELSVARGWSVADSAQTAIATSGDLNKKRQSFGTSAFATNDVRISATGAITAGTRTLDTNSIAIARGHVPATAANYAFIGEGVIHAPSASTFVEAAKPYILLDSTDTGQWPWVFVANEGLVLRATVPGTGTWEFTIHFEWDEVALTAGYN